MMNNLKSIRRGESAELPMPGDHCLGKRVRGPEESAVLRSMASVVDKYTYQKYRAFGGAE